VSSTEISAPEPDDVSSWLPEIVRPGARERLAEATRLWIESQRSPRTRVAYLHELRLYAAYLAEQRLDPLSVGKMEVDRYLAARQARGVEGEKAATTVARTRAALSSWYRYLVGCDLLTRNPMTAAVRTPVDRDYSPTRVLSRDEARALEYAAEHQPRSRGRDTRERNLVAVRLLLWVGMRAEELCDLRVGDFRVQQGKRVVALRSKGSKTILRALSSQTEAALHRYLAHRLDLGTEQAGRPTLSDLLGQFSGDALLLVTGTGHAVDRPSLTRVLQRLAAAARLERPNEITPHSLRHTFATVATEQGVPLDDLQDAMGHADPRTTRRYQRSARKLDHDPTHIVSAALG
jgi:integrase/recombinase XerD